MSGKLQRLEKIIHRSRGIDGFYQTGKALETIRDEKLYRDFCRNFKEYCIDRWDMARRTAYQYIAAAKVVDNVRKCAQIEPANEAQARPLTKFAPDQQKEIWTIVVNTAPGGKISAKFVKEVVAAYIGENSQGTDTIQNDFISLLTRGCSNCEKISRHLRQIGSQERFQETLREAESQVTAKFECFISPDSAIFSFSPGLNDDFSISFTVRWSNGQEERDGGSNSGGVEANRTENDPLKILGLPHGASQQEIEQARRKKAQMFHPDTLARFHFEELHAWIKEEAERRMKAINWAYETLSK